MRRRDFIAVTAAMGLVPAAWAQQRPMPLVGLLVPSSLANRFAVAALAAFRQGLKETGYVEGRNVAFEYRWAQDRYERLPALAADLVRRRASLIFAPTDPAALAAKTATPTIPTVFWTFGDPVRYGLVASLGHPGANATGISLIGVELIGKQMALLREFGRAGPIGVLVNPHSPAAASGTTEARQAARLLGLHSEVRQAGGDGEIEPAFRALAANRAAGLIIIGGDPFYNAKMPLLIELAARYAVPTLYSARRFVDHGGLISYGPRPADILRQAGIYAGRILAGAKPADLPVQQPTKFELVINLKTAKALGLTVPPLLLAQADEVIE
jgi:putative ABC transport system substrate-binding protein